MAESLQTALAGSPVGAAFHHLPARLLADARPGAWTADVLVCADRPEALTDETVDLVSSIPGLRPVDAGTLSMAGAIEAFTAVLLNVNMRYKTRAAVKLTGHCRRPVAMRLFDTARQEVVPFEPGPLVTMYTCGITPYDSAHMGHAATYVVYDVLQRRLRDLGHRTQCVRNVTDIDDPLFAKARDLGVHYLDLAAEELARFDACMEALGLLPVLQRAAGHRRHPRHPRASSAWSSTAATPTRPAARSTSPSARSRASAR